MVAWKRIVATASLAGALACVTGGARAADNILLGSAERLTTVVPGHPALTWGEALKLFLPDVHAGGDNTIEATRITKARRLDSADDVTADGPLHATWLSARDVVEGGRPRLLIFAEVDQPLSGTPGSALLALIDITVTEPRLLDVIDVGSDRENYLDSGPLPRIGLGSDLVLVSSAHLDAGAGYSIRTALFVDRDHFGAIASVPLLSLRLCGYERAQSAAFVVRPQPGAGFNALHLSVTERSKRFAEDCQPPLRAKAGVKSWSATFYWNPGKRAFVTASRALETLSRHNDESL